MTTSDVDQEEARREQELKVQWQIAFAAGLFQGDVTIRTLLESLAEGVVIIDSTGTILLVNSSAAQMFGYPEQELIGKPQSVLIPERFRKVHEEHEAQFFAEPRVRPKDQLHDLTGRRRDGSEFPVEISLSYIETISGILVVALVSDITLRKELEERLRESEEQFHIQVEGVQDYAIFMLDAEGNVLTWNAGAERLKGYQAEEIIGSHFSCFYPEEEQKAGKPEAELKEAALAGRIVSEGWRVRKDGSRFWADLIMTALYDKSGKLRGFSKVTHDITARKKAADALRTSEARYRALFRDNPIMIVTLDADLTMLSVNPVCASQLGYTIEELEGESVLKLFHEDDRPAVAEQLRNCLQNPNQVQRWQFRKIRKDGKMLWVEETAQAFNDLNGALNILVVCQDVSERKRLEDELKKSSRQKELILASAGEGIIGLDLDGNETFVNAAAAAMLGYDVNELVGKQSHATWHYARPDGTSYPMEKCPVYAAYKDGTIHSGEEMFLRKDGTFFPVQFTSRPIIIDGEIAGAVLTFNDVTARKEMEDALRESEERFRATFNQAAVGIAHVAPDGRWLRINQKYCDLLGYSEEELKGMTIKEITHPDDQKRSTKQFQLLLQGKLGNYSLEKRYLRKDGSTIWVNLTASMVFDATCKPVFAVGVAEDITKRKRAEEEREQLLMQLDAVLNSINEGVVIADLKGNILTMNPSALAFHEYASVEQVRRQLHQLLDTFEVSDLEGRTVPFEQWPLSLVLRGERFADVEVEVKRKDTGTLRIGSYSGTPVQTRSGDIILAVITVRDITERKRAEAEIQRLASFPLMNPNPVLELDANGTMTFCNPAAKQILENFGDNNSINPLIPQDMPEILQSLRDNKTGQFLREIEIDGRLFEELVYIAPQFQAARIYTMDITKRKRAEEEITKLNASLAARAAELEDVNRELEAFNYTVAHDLRKPLTVVNGYCQAIQDICSDNLDDSCKSYLQEAYDGTWRMNRLIDALLNFSQLTHVEPQRETVDLSSVAHEVATELQSVEPERRVTFRIADGARAVGDAALLRVILDNLLGNAWKYTVTREDAIIEFGTTEVDGKTVCFVRDNGNGFDMADAGKLFAPFQRLPGAEECRGFGIGLATVERIIKRHGGRVWAEGEPGKGACFYFTLSTT